MKVLLLAMVTGVAVGTLGADVVIPVSSSQRAVRAEVVRCFVQRTRARLASSLINHTTASLLIRT
jgi:hypothetical protein